MSSHWGLSQMLMSGIIGLFVGAVVLVVGYELFMLWLNGGEKTATDAPVDT